MNWLLLALRIVWASPASLLGLSVGLAAMPFGTRIRRKGAVLEIWGGGVAWLLRRLPMTRNVAAMTLGHTILARSWDDVETTRAHELVHVRQYERWGPLFIPAYLLASAALWFAGKNPYFDNPFEREAFDSTL